MAAYAEKHYGIHSWHLHPKVIVEHYTAQQQLLGGVEHVRREHARPGARRASRHLRPLHRRPRRDDLPARAPERHVPPHRRAQLRRDRDRARRDVRRRDPPRPAQIRASLELTAWLVDRFHIKIRNVIGHNESLSSPYHRELYKPWAHQTHADWKHADMDVTERSSARFSAPTRQR